MVQNMNEQRENNDLLGIGNAINTYRQEYNQGLSNSVKGVATLANATTTLPTSNTANSNMSASPQLGSTGIFGRDAVAIKNNNFNGNLIAPNNTNPNANYQDLINQYNNSLYRIR